MQQTMYENFIYSLVCSSCWFLLYNKKILCEIHIVAKFSFILLSGNFIQSSTIFFSYHPICLCMCQEQVNVCLNLNDHLIDYFTFTFIYFVMLLSLIFVCLSENLLQGVVVQAKNVLFILASFHLVINCSYPLLTSRN